MGDHGAGFREGAQNAGLQGLAVDLAAGGGHDELHEGSDLSALQDLCGCRQVLQPAVGAGAQENLVHRNAGDLADGVDVVHLGRTGHHRDQVLRAVGEGAFVNSIGVSVEGLQEGVLPEIIRRDPAVLRRFFIGGEEAALGSAFHCHVGHGHTGGDAHGFDSAAGELERFVGRAVGPQVAQNTEDDVLGGDIVRESAVDLDSDRLRDPDPEFSGAQNAGHFRVADPGGKGAHTAVGCGVAVRAKGDVSRLYITRLGHQLVADAVRPMDIFDTVLRGKSIALCEMAGVVDLAGRDQMVVDEDHPVGIPDSGEAHLLEFVRHKGDKDVVDHDPVHIDGDDLAGSHFFAPDIVRNDFFNESLSHHAPPFDPEPSEQAVQDAVFSGEETPIPFSLCMALTRPPASRISRRFWGSGEMGYSLPL